MHFIERYRMMAIKIRQVRAQISAGQAIPSSSFQERSSSARPRGWAKGQGQPGHADPAGQEGGKVTTIILRGATDHLMDDGERY